MAEQIVNLTQLMVIRGVDLVLSTLPNALQQSVFQQPDLRHKLILYVLKRSPSSYITVDSDQPELLRNQIQRLAFKQQQQLKSLIYEGIDYLYPICPEDSLSIPPVQTRFPTSPPGL